MTLTLVVGATGTVGSAVVRNLVAARQPVRALVRDPGQALNAFGSSASLAVGDLADPASLARALTGVDQVFLACANRPDQAALETAMIDAAQEAGVQRLVKLSAHGARPGSPVEFWDNHAVVERRLAASGLAVTVLRPTTYMTNLLGAAAAVRSSGLLLAPVALARIAMIDPADVAQVAARVLREDGHEGNTYLLTGSELLTFEDIAVALTKATRRQVRYVPVSAEQARQGMLSSGAPAWFVDNLLRVYAALRAGIAEVRTGTVHTLTGNPPGRFDAFAQRYAAAFTPGAGRAA